MASWRRQHSSLEFAHREWKAIGEEGTAQQKALRCGRVIDVAVAWC